MLSYQLQFNMCNDTDTYLDWEVRYIEASGVD